MESTKELTELLNLLCDTVNVAVKASEDGKVDLADLPLLFNIIPEVGPAFQGVDKIPAELADLTTEEASELVTHVAARLLVTDAHAKAVIDAALKAAVANYNLYAAIKNKVA